MRVGQMARWLLPLALLLPMAGCLLLQPVSREPLSSPFSLTAAQQSELLAVLKRRDRKLADRKSLSCTVTRFTYDEVFGERNRPDCDHGKLELTASGQGRLELAGAREETYGWDTNSFCIWSRDGKAVFKGELPPHLQHLPLGPAVLNLLFWSKAEELQNRYYWRVVTPHACQDQIWLEAFPRFADEAALVSRLDLILGADDLHLRAAQVHHDAQGRHRTVWVFEKAILDTSSLDLKPESPAG